MVKSHFFIKILTIELTMLVFRFHIFVFFVNASVPQTSVNKKMLLAKYFTRKDNVIFMTIIEYPLLLHRRIGIFKFFTGENSCFIKRNQLVFFFFFMFFFFFSNLQNTTQTIIVLMHQQYFRIDSTTVYAPRH